MIRPDDHTSRVHRNPQTPRRSKQTPQQAKRRRKSKARGSERTHPQQRTTTDGPEASRRQQAPQTTQQQRPRQRGRKAHRKGKRSKRAHQGQAKQNRNKTRKEKLGSITIKGGGMCICMLLFVVCVLLLASKIRRAGLPNATD